jgi:hypothetical protein
VTRRRNQPEIAEMFVDPGSECVSCLGPIRFYGQVLCRDCLTTYTEKFPRLAIISRRVDEIAKNHRDAVHAGKTPPTRLAYDNLARLIAEYLARARNVGDPEELRAAGLMASTIMALARRAGPYQAKRAAASEASRAAVVKQQTKLATLKTSIVATLQAHDGRIDAPALRRLLQESGALETEDSEITRQATARFHVASPSFGAPRSSGKRAADFEATGCLSRPYRCEGSAARGGSRTHHLKLTKQEFYR